MSYNTVENPVDPIFPDGASYLDLNNFALIAPKDAKGISGFVFDVTEREEIELSSDVTDHYTEDNSFLNDHIVVKPNMIRLSGFIGELAFKPPEGAQARLQELENRLTVVDAYLGQFTGSMGAKLAGAVGKTETALQTINNYIEQSKNFVDFLNGDQGLFLSKQKDAFYNFTALQKMKAIVSVTLPWGFFSSMVITSLSFRQGAETQYWSEISVTLKEMRFAEVKTTNFEENLFATRSEMQESEEQDAGIVQGVEETEDVSAFYSFFGDALQ